MPGVIYRALSKTNYAFSSLAAAATATPIVAKGIDVSAYREATLLIRIHPGAVTTGGSATITVLAEAPTPEDPGTDFVANIAGGATSAITITANSSLTLFPVPTPYGSSIRLQLTATQGGTGSATFTFAMSIDVVAKS